MRKLLYCLASVGLLASMGCLVSSSSSSAPAPARPSPTTAPAVNPNAGSPEAAPRNAGGKATPGAITPETTKLEWVGTKTGGRHTGSFASFTGKIDPIGDDITKSTITVDIDTDSLTSDNGKLTGHLKSADFFDTKTHPKASFVSTKIEAAKEGDNTHKITGDLTLHGTKKSIAFPAKVSNAGDTLKLESSFKIKRSEFGMTYGQGKVDDDVSLSVVVQTPRK